MMSAVKVYHVTASGAIDLKNSLIAAGLKTDVDFVWRYFQVKYDNFSSDAVTPSMAVFDFAEESVATFYRLKWSADQ